MITKSNYVSFCKCPRSLYLSIYKKDEKIDNTESIRKGNEVGALARELFPNSVLVGKDTLDMEKKAEETTNYLNNGVETICEASFIYRDLFCAIDILNVTEDGMEIYEVKSVAATTKDTLLSYYQDIAFQYYVLNRLGYKVNKAYLVILNDEYVRGEEIDVSSLFKFIRVDEVKAFQKEVDRVRASLNSVRTIINGAIEEEMELTSRCINNTCPFSSYCLRDLREDSVLNVYNCRKKVELYNNGVDTFEKLLKEKGSELSKVQLRQIDFYLNNNEGLYIEKDKVNEFIENIKFPIYFLDFETINEAIPPFKNSRVYQQIPVQFSLHVLESDGTMEHYEYLGDGINDARGDVASLLRKYIKDDDGSIISYNASFEKGRIFELCEIYPEYKDLMNLEDRFVDLLDLFKKGYIYNKKMGKSFSIKSTLPALCDVDVDYHSLDQVHNGTEAMKVYNELKTMNDEEKLRARKNLLEYCKLDTYAMVVLYNKIIELGK